MKRVWLIYPDQPVGERVLVTHGGGTEIVSVGLDLGAAWERVQAKLDRLAMDFPRHAPPAKAIVLTQTLGSTYID